MATEQGQSIEVFFSYVHKDEPLCQELEKHLSTLKQQKLIESWYNHKISPGQMQAQEIQRYMQQAQIILLLLSSDFMASDYYSGAEVKQAMERHRLGISRVIPILLRPVDWQGTPFAHLQALPRNEKAITTWPNPDEAFEEVAREIRLIVEEIQKHPLVPNNAPSTPRHNIPYEPNVYFTGRGEILQRLYSSLRMGNTTALTQAISGLGGIGKTQTAIEYAWRYQEEYDTILWIGADSQETIFSDMHKIAQLLDLPERQEQDQERLVQAIKVWLRTHTRWLLIFDNADDLAVVQPFLPFHTSGHIVITTRDQSTARIAQRIALDYLEPEQGALFLLRRATLLGLKDSLEQAAPEDQQLAKQLSRLLGGLPLALDQAGAYIEETQCGLQKYLQLYQKEQTQFLKRRGKLTTDHPEPVYNTWLLSFAKVEKANPAAADLLRLCAFLDPDAIPEELFSEAIEVLPPTLRRLVSNQRTFQEALGLLLSYSLIRRNPGQTLTMHRLVQLVLREQMKPQAQRRWAERTIQVVNECFPNSEYATWNQCLQYLPHALSCRIWSEQWSIEIPEAANLLSKAGTYQYDIAFYEEAEPLYQRALAIRERTQGVEHPDTATVLNNLAILYQDQGRTEEAESLYQRALAIRERTQGVEHPDTAMVLNNLAGFYRDQGRDDDAEKLFH